MDTNIASNAEVVRRTAARSSRSRAVRAVGSSSVGAPRSVWAALFGPLGPGASVIDELQAIVVARELPIGSVLMSRHEPACDLLVLASGDAALGCLQPGAPFQPERSLQGPEWLDAASALLGGTPPQDAVALSQVQLLALPQAALQPLLVRHPELASQLLLVLARQVHQLTTVAHDLMHKDAESRFAHWLLQRCNGPADAAGRAVITLHERKRDIAAQLGITPETLSRLLRQLSRKGLLEVKGYTVAVRDVPALRAIAGT